MSLRVFTVDDEPLALRRMQIVLDELADVEHVGGARGCEEAVLAIAQKRPDVLLLDIKMRDGLGFEILEGLPPDYAPAVIFVTAFDGFATRAFEVEAVDYLLKPVETERVRSALGRYR